MEGAYLWPLGKLLRKYLSQVLSKVACLKSLEFSWVLVMNVQATGKYHQLSLTKKKKKNAENI